MPDSDSEWRPEERKTTQQCCEKPTLCQMSEWRLIVKIVEKKEKTETANRNLNKRASFCYEMRKNPEFVPGRGPRASLITANGMKRLAAIAYLAGQKWPCSEFNRCAYLVAGRTCANVDSGRVYKRYLWHHDSEAITHDDETIPHAER